MEFSRQIKKYRMEAHLSQEELADKVFVSRQTISNWENDKGYPDVKSLLLISEVFQITLDNLIKGDLEKMKKEIDVREHEKIRRDSNIFTILFVAILILPVPLVMLWKWYGLAIYLIVFAVGMYYALRIEKYKKKYDVQTYKEIIAFMEGEDLNEIEKAREDGKKFVIEKNESSRCNMEKFVLQRFLFYRIMGFVEVKLRNVRYLQRKDMVL